MKKNLLLLLMIFSALNLFSQIEKGNISIGLDGNFMKVNTQNGVSTNNNYTKGKYLNMGISAGYFISDRFVAGVGLDYIRDKENRYNSLYFNNFLQSEAMDIKTNALLPNVFVGYYYQIINKLYMSGTFKLSYGKIKTEYNTLYVGTGPFTDSTVTNIPYQEGSSGNSETDYFNATMFPEVMYFISSKFGLCLNLGGITYTLNDWKTDNSNLIFSFKPDYWRFGIKFKL